MADGMDTEQFSPMSAREALLQLRAEIGLRNSVGSESARFQIIIAAGLDLSASANFTLTDQLADRLAEAHKVLRLLDEKGVERRIALGDLEDVAAKAREALALPPDLEAMVERRIGSQ